MVIGRLRVLAIGPVRDVQHAACTRSQSNAALHAQLEGEQQRREDAPPDAARRALSGADAR